LPTKNLYRVTYHFEVNGKPVSENFQDNVLAAAADANSLTAVLSSNGKTNNGRGTLVISGVGHACGGDQGILS
jgi:hypothetical protein